MTRGDRDADAGIAGEAMAVAIERRSQRLIDPRNQRADIVIVFGEALQDGEFVAAEAGDKVLRSDRLTQPLGAPLRIRRRSNAGNH
jgi:hypothetical protein